MMSSVSIVKASALFALILVVGVVEYNCEKYNDDYYESRGKFGRIVIWFDFFLFTYISH